MLYEVITNLMSQKSFKRKVSGILSADELVAAFQAQSALFEKFISMAKSPDEPEVIESMLRETIGISIELTGANLGSLILLRITSYNVCYTKLLRQCRS